MGQANRLNKKEIAEKKIAKGKRFLHLYHFISPGTEAITAYQAAKRRGLLKDTNTPTLAHGVQP
jgi:hypothetical protein